MNNRYLMNENGDKYAGEDGLWTLDELETAVLDASGSLADSLRDQVVERCTGVSTAVDPLSGTTVDITESCTILQEWDGRDGIDSVGAILWREMIGSGVFSTSELGDKGRLFSDAFDPSNPVYTPTVLAESDEILGSMAAAVLTLQRAGLEPDVRLGDVQFRQRGEEKIPVSGGPYFAGVIAVSTHSGGGNTTLLPVPQQGAVVNSTTDLTDEGYLINNGNSWVMVMSFEDEGPVARAAMTYSQSEDPDSPHFKDQTELYAEETLRDVAFTEDQITSKLVEQKTLVYP